MRKWLKFLVYILIILAIVFLLLPFVMGLFAESKYKQLANINSSIFPFQVKIVSYNRGWFSADSVAQISFDKLKAKDQKLNQFLVTAHIIHGPILADWLHTQFAIAVIKADFNLNEVQQALLKRTISAGPIAQAKIKIKLTASTNIIFEIQPFYYADAKNSFQWKGMKMMLEFSSMLNKMRAKVNLFGIDARIGKNHSLYLGEVIDDYQGKKIVDDVWFGKNNLQIETFATKDENNHSIVFNDLNMYTKIADKGKVNAVVSIFLENLKLDNNGYNKNNFSLEINNLNKNLFIKVWQQYLNPDKASLWQLTNPKHDALIALLSNGGEINIKQFNTTSLWGKLLATTKIIFANQPDNKNIFAILMNSTVNAKVKIERGFAVHLIENLYKETQVQKKPKVSVNELAKALLNEWQNTGKITITDKDSYLQAYFIYKDRQFLLNDKPLIITNRT